MGAWSVSITGNDTAEDLRMEYQAAFFYNDVDVALEKIDTYVRTMFDESDEEEWCNYYYSLCDFMWRKGILTEEVKARTLNMIDSGFGLELWAEAGSRTLNQRKKALAKFRNKITSEQPAKKKIRIDLFMNSIFETGDMVAIQLQTLNKHYIANEVNFDEQTFRDFDGKYIVMRKVTDHISYHSDIEPNVRDIYSVFQLYAKVFDECPSMEQLKDVPWANTRREHNGMFACESSMYYFKKRNFKVIGNNTDNLQKAIDEYRYDANIFFRINKPWYNPETEFLKAIFPKSDTN